MIRHRKRERTNKNTMEIREDRLEESDSYGYNGSDSEIEYGLVNHKIDLLSLSRQSFEAELSEAEDYEIFEYDSEDAFEEPYHDMMSFGESEDDQSSKAPVPPPMQFRDEALELSIPPLPDLCCSEIEESDLDCNDEPYEPQNEDLVICLPPGFVGKAPWNEDFVIGVTGLEDKKMDRTSNMVKKNVEKFDNIALRVSIAGINMWVEIGSCSSKTMMDEVAFRKILDNQKITLNKPKNKAAAYGGSETPLVGSFLTTIETKKKIVSDTNMVVKGETGSRPLLAGKTALGLGILAIPRRNHCFDSSPDTLGEFCSMNPDLVNYGKKSQGNAKVGSQVRTNKIPDCIRDFSHAFSNKLGKHKYIKVRLDVEKSATPVAQPPRKNQEKLSEHLKKLKEMILLKMHQLIDQQPGYQIWYLHLNKRILIQLR